MLGRTGLVAVYAGLSAAVLVPIFAVQVPCLGDYLNHLARISIMGKLGASPAIDAFYQARWKFVPYYGMDIPVIALSRVMGIYAAGRVFAGVCLLMPVAAAAVLRRVVVGRSGLMPVGAFLFCYNYMFERGLFPYLFTVGLAIMLFAAWIATVDWPRWKRAAVFAAGALVVYLGHAFGFATYCILVGGFELGWAWQARFRPRGEVVGRLAAAVAQAVPALLIGALLGGNENISAASFTRYGDFADKLGAALSPLYFPGGIATALLVVFVAVCGAVFGRRAGIAPALRGPVIAVGVVAALTPRILFNIWGGDLRLPLVLVIVVLAGLVPGPRVGRRSAGVLLAACMTLVMLRAGEAWALLRALDGQVEGVRDVVGALPQGKRLLVVELAGAGAGRVAPTAMTGHLAMVAVIDRDAFVPYLFIGNTPVVPRAGLRDSSSSISSAIDLGQLWDGYKRGDPPGGAPVFGWGGRMYWLGWVGKFDYVLVEHFGAAVGGLPGVLRRVSKGAVADLYAVDGGAGR